MNRQAVKAECREVVKMIRFIRESGENGKLALVLEEELVDNRSWLAKRDYENQLMQQCIMGVIEGQSPCKWCEDYHLCSKKPMEEQPFGFRFGKGCKDWWLRFLTEEEEKNCEQRAAQTGTAKRETLDGDEQGTKAGSVV